MEDDFVSAHGIAHIDDTTEKTPSRKWNTWYFRLTNYFSVQSSVIFQCDKRSATYSDQSAGEGERWLDHQERTSHQTSPGGTTEVSPRLVRRRMSRAILSSEMITAESTLVWGMALLGLLARGIPEHLFQCRYWSWWSIFTTGNVRFWPETIVWYISTLRTTFNRKRWCHQL